MKLPWQYVKKRPLKITADSEQNIKKSQNSRKEVADVTEKEEILEKTGRVVEGDEEAKKRDSTGQVECRGNQNIKALIKDGSKKHRMVDVNPQQLRQNTQTKKVDYSSDFLQKYFVPDSSVSVKKVKLCDSDRKLDQTHAETKMFKDNLVECQKKGNSGGLKRCTKMEQVTEQVDDHNKLQLLEGHQKADENVGKKSEIDITIEETGSIKETVDRDSRRAVVDKHRSARRKQCSSNSARQHVCRALYRALSSR